MQILDLRGVPMDELVNLFSAHLKTWISTNTEITETLLKEEK